MSYDKWAKVIRALSLPEAAIACATGDLRLPEESGEVPFASYGFPPALIPLWSYQGPGYFGFWWHWGGRRRTTVVKLIVEAGYRAYEYARSFEQLMTLVAHEKLSADEGVISEELRAFATAAGVDDLDDLARIVEESGDHPSGLLQRPEFVQDPPLKCFDEDPEAYSGDFPTGLGGERSSDSSRFAGLEGPRTVAQRIASQPGAPPWFKVTKQREVFDACLRAGDYQGAWMSLNSPGWRFADAGVALAGLAQRTGDPILHLLTEAWRSERHADFGGY